MLTDKIATFEKVSKEQFIKDFVTHVRKKKFDPCMMNDIEMNDMYDRIKCPARATEGSVGYDFYLPFSLYLEPGETIVIPTGIRCNITYGYSLDIYPKSGLGFKNHTVLANTIGIIDADYYASDNEGHIMVKFINQGFNVTKNHNEGEFSVHDFYRNCGESFVQGIFHECFGATNDVDQTFAIRNGGFDSTNK